MPMETSMQTKTLKIRIMKNLILFSIIAAVLVACGSAETPGISELDSLKVKKDSLKLVKDGLSEEIAALEKQIAALDTTKQLTLVTTEKARIDRFKHYFEVYGNVETDQNAQIYSELSGKILAINVKEGDRVKKGQSLMQIDASILKEQEQELLTRLELAETTYEKQKKLWDKKIGSEMQYLQAKNNRDALRRSLETVRTQIDMASVKAPFDGVVDEVFPKKGEMAMPGVPMARLVNLNNVYVKADVSENYMGQVKQGDPIKVSIPSIGLEKTSVIERTGQYINPANRTFKIKTTLNNSDNLLKPNMVALLEVEDFSADTAVVIPANLIMQGAGGKDYVYVIDSEGGVSTARKVPVKVGMTYKGVAMIENGLTGSEELVSKGARNIRNGEQVEVKKG